MLLIINYIHYIHSQAIDSMCFAENKFRQKNYELIALFRKSKNEICSFRYG